MNFFSKVVSFDEEKCQIVLDIYYADDEFWEYVKDIFTQEEILRTIFKSKVRKFDAKTWEQHKKWYACITTMMKYYNKKVGLELTKENKDALHYQMKRSFFPCTYIDLGGESPIPKVPSINDLSFDQLFEATAKLISTYMDIGIDFDEYAR